ncbi:MAG: choice-of-anchor D domain-containing protein [Deltaproteobacteria bacterium]|nr:choice-of-anchor D domain-containing protein [Deltaproteobacteria bacterium]
MLKLRKTIALLAAGVLCAAASLLPGCEDDVNLGGIRPVVWMGQDWDGDGQVQALPADPEGQADHLLDFGRVVVRQRASLSLVLANQAAAKGALKWTAESIYLAEGTSGDFYLETPPVNELAPGDSTYLTVHYIPAEEGPDAGTVVIETNDPDHPALAVRLSGEGVSPDVQVCLLDPEGGELCNEEVLPGVLQVDLGMNELGEVSSQQIAVRNVGVFALTVAAGSAQQGVDFASGTSSEYSLDPEPWSGTLQPGEEKRFTIRYSPYDGGADEARLEVTSNDPDDDEQVVIVALLGNGLAPKICPEPPFAVDFGSIQVGSASEKTYRFTSCGNQVLTVTGLDLDPGPDGYFSFSSSVATPFDLSPGEAFDMQLRYAPVTEGSHHGQVTIRSNDPNAGEGWIDLVGRATPEPQCGIQVSPAQINFGDVPTTGFANQTLAISNTGDADCQVTAIQGPVGSQEFSLPGLPSLPLTIQPGEMRAISVRYDPVDEGPDQATLTVVVAAPEGVAPEVSLIGNGIQPPPCDFRADPALLSFGSTPMGQPRDLVTRIWNFGSDNCTLWDWELLQGSDPSFSFSARPFPFPTVDSGDYHEITVTFNPQSGGVLSGTLEVKGGENPFSVDRIHVALTGGGESARMCLNPEVLDFGPLAVGSVRTMSFTITACGPGNLRIRQIVFDGANPDFTFASVPGAPRTIPAGQSHTVQVQYSPSEPGADFGRILVSGNDDQQPTGVVELVGNYAGDCPSVFDCQPSALSFPQTELGRSRDLSFACTNHGTEALTVSSVAAGSGTTPEFHISAPDVPRTVAPNEQLHVEVGYIPTDIGYDTGSVVVTSEFSSAGCENFTLITVPLEAEGTTPDLPPCIAAQTFQPELIFQWPAGSISNPTFQQVFMTPVVINLTDDNGDGFIDENDVPDIVFNSYDYFHDMTIPAAESMIRAISGDDGHEIFTVDDPRFRTNCETQVAAADIDGDNLPEILASKYVVADSGDFQGRFVTGNVLCFEHDGTYKWESEAWHAPEEEIEDGSAIGVADLDHDGHPEVFRGPSVYNYRGELLWEGEAGRGSMGHGVFCTAADLDMQGEMELICGNTAYRHDGAIFWQASKPDGLSAVADFDLDRWPEVLLFASGFGGGTVILDGQTGAIRSTLADSEVNAILVPVIADIDGAGAPEFGVVGCCEVPGMEDGGECFWGVDVNESSLAMSVLWREELNDTTLGGGNSAFDFQGDGPFEVLQNDETYVNIYSGLAHNQIYQAERNSVTGWENPLVVDVNNDNHAEIIVIENGMLGMGGILVYGNAGATKWVETKRVWNQFDYHITNIRENGTVPRFEVPNWTVYNSFLANEPFCE